MGEKERERQERAGVLYSYYRLFAEVVCLSDTPHAKKCCDVHMETSERSTWRFSKERGVLIVLLHGELLHVLTGVEVAARAWWEDESPKVERSQTQASKELQAGE